MRHVTNRVGQANSRANPQSSMINKNYQMAPSPNLNLCKYRMSNSRGGSRGQPGGGGGGVGGINPNNVNLTDILVTILTIRVQTGKAPIATVQIILTSFLAQ